MMTSITTKLSVSTSNDWKTTLSNIEFFQHRKIFDGGYSINFVNALSAAVDYAAKDYSDFFLTRECLGSQIINYNITDYVSDGTTSYLQNGEEFLTASEILTSQTTRQVSFKPTESIFNITFLEDQLCHVSTTIDTNVFYLCVENNDLIFKSSRLISQTNTADDDHIFKYMMADNYKRLHLLKQISGTPYNVVRKDNTLILREATINNKFDYSVASLKISRPKRFINTINMNSSFVKYDPDNDIIDGNNSSFNLVNNYLIHSPHTSNYHDILVLKNQKAISETFINGNSLLSSSAINPVDKMREYTSINTTIDRERDTELSLNYVFYNEPYKITSGITYFASPSSMYPFNKLNINDTKFIECGAFASFTPHYADKVFHVENNRNLNNNGATLLCTWLSGSASGDKLWVDRYYYPDLIDKQSALLGKNIFDVTYDRAIENLILSNSSLSSSVSVKKFFDKRSDLVFEPNNIYKYDRIKSEEIDIQEIDLCNDSPIDYYTKINDSGEITLSFLFYGDNSEWIIKSNRNEINGGIKISKNRNEIYFEFILYNPATSGYETYSVTTDFKKLKNNYVVFSYDSFNGLGYFFLNNKIILNISTQVVSYSGKKLLFGNILYNETSIFEATGSFDNFKIGNKFLEKDMAFLLPYLDRTQVIQPIYVTLPCGMRNSLDDIKFINNICEISSYKSNDIVISLDNLGISSTALIESIKNYITDIVFQNIPANVNLKEIKTVNYL